MMKKFIKLFLGFLLLLILGVTAFVYFQFQSVKSGLITANDGINRPSLTQSHRPHSPAKSFPTYSLPHFDFQVSEFSNPHLKYGPYTRWWWPGNDVDSLRLKAEIQKFAEMGIAGVEIQPFNMGMNPNMPEDRKKRVNSWDSPSFYANLETVMKEALKEGLTVDLNSTGGWPTGGTHVTLEDNFKTLLHSEQKVSGGQTWKGTVMYPKPPFTMFLGGVIEKLVGREVLQGSKIYSDHARLEHVSAYKIIDDQRTDNIFDVKSQIVLDSASMVSLDNNLNGNELTWEVPEGDWLIVGFWSLPADEAPVLAPVSEKAYVIDHLDSVRVKANYEYLFGDRTGLEKYYGAPMRALFNDSYEFTVERHFSDDFFDFFKKKRGYDIRPYLPVNMIPGKNHSYAHIFGLKSKPAFVFGEEDWRLVHDYDLTVSELLEEHFFKSTKTWLNQRGMLHRTQAYGMPMDNMKAAAYVDIPEAEYLYVQFSYAFLKQVSSGSFLYNRPFTSAESVVFQERAYLTSPLKAKVALDKAFSNGINHTIYHGIAYPYFNEDYSKIGWYPWLNPYFPGANFSFDYRETNPILWNYMPAINTYVRRTQYALQSGKPKKDVLVYFPFLGIGYQNDVADNNEILKAGYFEGNEPKIPQASLQIPFMGEEEESPSPNVLWLQKVYPILNKIESSGLDWAWVNDHSIMEAKVENGLIHIRGNYIEKMILPEIPFIPLKVIKKLDELASQGGEIVFLGKLPDQQPGFKDFATRDKVVQDLLTSSINSQKFKHIKDIDFQITGTNSVGSFKTLNPDISLTKRIMSDRSMVIFYANKTARPIEFDIYIPDDFRSKTLLDPFDGEVWKLENDHIKLEAYGSAIVYLSKSRRDDYKPMVPQTKPLMSITLNTWNININGHNFAEKEPFNWITRKETKYASEGIYETSFTLDESYSSVVLKLDDFVHAATIYVNGKQVDQLILPPYETDIAGYLQKGENYIKIEVHAPLYNYIIGEAENGNEYFSQLKGKEKEVGLMGTGLAGAIRLIIFR